jgi:hypothetical protein
MGDRGTTGEYTMTFQAGDVIVFTFGPSIWVAPVISGRVEIVSMYRDDNPTPVVRVEALREQFGKYPNRPNDIILVPLDSIIAR